MVTMPVSAGHAATSEEEEDGSLRVRLPDRRHPDRPLRLLLPTSGGGDTQLRLVGMSQGQSVVHL